MPSFIDRLLQRRNPLSTIGGFAGGNLQDQLDRDQNPTRPRGTPRVDTDWTAAIEAERPRLAEQQPFPPPTGQILTSANQTAITRPRTVNASQVPADQPDTRPRSVNSPFADRLMSGMSAGDIRPRIADPVGFDVQHLRDLQAQKDPRWEKILNATAAGVASAAQGGAPIRPIPTRRERDIERVGGQLGTELGVQHAQAQDAGLKSQMDAREAAILNNQTRQEQRDRELGISEDRLKQKQQQDYHANLLREFNGRTDFDPEDPKEADFVAEWQRAFGRKPSKNVRGSQMAVIQGYRPDGTPIVSIVNKGTGTATAVTGDTPATTEGQQNRAQREGQFNQAEAGRMTRAGMRQGGGAAAPDRATSRRAAQLIGKIDQSKREISSADELLKRRPNDPKVMAARTKAQADGEGAASELNALNAGYEAGPGDQGYPYYKQKEQAAPQGNGQYAGQRISKARLPEAAKRLKMSVADAQKYLVSEGAIIY